MWIWVILGIILGIVLILPESYEDLHRVYYNDEDNFMEDLEEWILVEDLEEELEDDGYFDDEG